MSQGSEEILTNISNSCQNSFAQHLVHCHDYILGSAPYSQISEKKSDMKQQYTSQMYCMIKEKVSPKSSIIVITNASKSLKHLLKSQHPSQYHLAQLASFC